jgi:hypothetical protein
MKTAIVLLAATFLCLTSCSKSSDDVPDCYFMVNKKTGVTPYGYFYTSGTAKSIDLWSEPRSAGYNGAIHYASLSIDTLIDGQEYEYHARDTTGFDSGKNFSAATIILDGVAHGTDPITMDDNTMLLQDVNGGKVTVHRQGGKYTLDYALTFGSVQVKGRYIGTLQTY